jgi:hypothetical protein
MAAPIILTSRQLRRKFGLAAIQRNLAKKTGRNKERCANNPKLKGGDKNWSRFDKLSAGSDRAARRDLHQGPGQPTIRSGKHLYG